MEVTIRKGIKRSLGREDIDFCADIEKSLYSWDESLLIMVNDLFNVLLDANC